MALIRVAQVVRPAEGGMRRHVSSILARLSRSEFALTLFAPPGFHLDPASDGVERVSIPIAVAASPLRDLRAIVQLARRLRRGFDLVHAHGLRGALVGVSAAKITGVPAIFTAHNLAPARGRQSGALLRFLGRSARPIAVSHAVAGSLARRGIDESRIAVISNGVDPAEFESPPGDERERRRILAALIENAAWSSAAEEFASLRDATEPLLPLTVVAGVGRLAPEKGFDLLIAAFAAMSANSPAGTRLHLIIAGTGDEEARLRREAAFVPNVTLTGALDVVKPLIACADIVAIPSRSEGQGLVALEAMAAGRAVVATRVGGLVESVVDGETGLLAAPDDPSALRAAIEALAGDADRRRCMGAEGRRRVLERFTLDAMMERLALLYRETAAVAAARSR